MKKLPKAGIPPPWIPLTTMEEKTSSPRTRTSSFRCCPVGVMVIENSTALRSCHQFKWMCCGFRSSDKTGSPEPNPFSVIVSAHLWVGSEGGVSFILVFIFIFLFVCCPSSRVELNWVELRSAIAIIYFNYFSVLALHTSNVWSFVLAAVISNSRAPQIAHEMLVEYFMALLVIMGLTAPVDKQSRRSSQYFGEYGFKSNQTAEQQTTLKGLSPLGTGAGQSHQKWHNKWECLSGWYWKSEMGSAKQFQLELGIWRGLHRATDL